MSFTEVRRRFTPSSAAKGRARADALIEWLRDYAPRRIDSRVFDERRCISPGVVLDLGREGFFGLQVPEAFGGLALPYGELARVEAQLGAIDLSFSVFVDLQRCLGSRAIVAFGSPELQAELLPQLAAGRMLAGYAQTEVSAGADFQALTTRAVRNPPSGWTLQGDKTWIGMAAWAGVLVTICQTHDHPEDESRGISAFAVRTRERGVRVGPELLSMGMRAFPQNRVWFNAVSLRDTDALGEPGEGLYTAIDCMSSSRLGISMRAVGVMRRAIQLIGRFASRRKLRGEPLIGKPGVLPIVGRLLAETEAVARSVGRCAAILDRDEPLPMEIPLALKVAASEFAFDVVDAAMQLLGSRGYDEVNGVAQMLRDVRVLRIFEGPTEALVDFLGQRLASARRKDFCRFLELELDAPHAARELEAAVAAARGPGRVPPGAIGWAGVWALVAAALEPVGAPARAAMSAWAQRELEAACLAVTQGHPADAFLELRGEVEAMVRDCRESIGDLLVSAPNESVHPDDAIALPSAG